MDLLADRGYGGTFNEGLMLYLQNANGTSQGSLPGLKSAFSSAQGGTSSLWNAANDTWNASTEPFVGAGGGTGRWGDVTTL